MVDPARRVINVLAAMIAIVIPIGSLYAQRIAILTPDHSVDDARYAEQLSTALSRTFRIADAGQSDAAFKSVAILSPFNMTVDEARSVGAVVGCDQFVIVRTATQRRESFSRPEYYEAFAVIYLISGRSGEMSSWLLKKFEEDSAAKASEKLFAGVNPTVAELSTAIASATAKDLRPTSRVKMDEVPVEGSPAAANLKPPIPYKRIKPEYTTTAFLYSVRATVEIEADIDADGKILDTRIVRWAGYGLDESVETAVRAMNWRPAIRSSKPLPMRVLLRYNFTKVEKE